MCRVSRLVCGGSGKSRAHREEGVEQSWRHIIGAARSCGTVPSVSFTHQRYAAECAVGCVNRLARVLMDMAPTINVNPINKILMSKIQGEGCHTAFDSRTPFHPSQRAFILHPSSFPPLLSSCRPFNHHTLTRSRLLIVLSVTTSSGV